MLLANKLHSKIKTKQKPFTHVHIIISSKFFQCFLLLFLYIFVYGIIQLLILYQKKKNSRTDLSSWSTDYL